MIEGESNKFLNDCSPECRRRRKKIAYSEWDKNLFELFLQTLLPNAKKSQTGNIHKSLIGNVLQSNEKTKLERRTYLSKFEKENLYVEVLYTIKHKIGSTSGGHSPFIQDLYHHAQKVFNISDKDHRLLLIAASEEKPPVVVLNATVIQAKNLEAKDADGLSDPYIMLGIIPGKRSDDQERENLEVIDDYRLSDGMNTFQSMQVTKDKSPRGLRKLGKGYSKKTGSNDKFLNVKSGNREKSPNNKGSALKESIPAKYIQTTSVKPNTLNPVWNELFHFDIDNINSDKLHLDIWDHDDEENVFDAVKRLNQIRGVKGLTRYFKQVGQSARSSNGDVDDFLGCITIDLDNIPSVGIRQWYTLEGRNSKSHAEGEIELDIKLSTREYRNLSAEGNWLDVLQHVDLLEMFIDYELHSCMEGSKAWAGELKEEAETILHQHAIQGDITELQILVCRWLAISKIYNATECNHTVLINLLNQMEKCWQPGQLSRDEISLLAKSYKLFIENCLEAIKTYRQRFPSSDERNSKYLQQMLRILYSIANSIIYKSVSPFENEISSQQVSAVKISAIEFFDGTLSRIEKDVKIEENESSKTLLKYLQLIKEINVDLCLIEDFYHDIFVKESKLKLFSLTYKVFNKKMYKLLFETHALGSLHQLFDDIINDFESFTCYKSFLDLFSLFSNLQQFYSYQDLLVTDDFRSFEAIDYRSWFKPLFDQWLFYIKHKLEKNICFQIDGDELHSTVDQILLCSTSAVNVANSFEIIEHIWRRLQWTDVNQKMIYVTQFTQIIGDCALLYADTLHEKIRLAGYFDECGQFDLSRQVCIALNNITSIDLSLGRLPIDLSFEQTIADIISTSGDKNSGKAFLESLFLLLKERRDHIAGVIVNIIQRVIGKMRPEIRKNIFHLCWSPQSVNIEKASSDLLTYLLGNITLVKKQMHSATFSKAILTIWSEVLSQIQEQAHKEVDEKEDDNNDPGSDKFVISRLVKSLDILLQSFIDVDDNICSTILETDQFKNLKYLLKLYMANTNEIVEKYFQEKQLEQDNWDLSEDLGYLTLRVFYRRNSTTLVVDILNASNLVPLDSNGLSDPFIILELAPNHLYDMALKPLKTKIIKNTLNPEFNESFEIGIRHDQINRLGATLVLTIMDHDMLITDDLEGFVFINLNNIPGIIDEINEESNIKPITLPLINLKYEANKALFVLSKQKTDNYAHETLKKWMPLEKC